MRFTLDRLLFYVARALEALITVQLGAWVIVGLLVLLTLADA